VRAHAALLWFASAACVALAAAAQPSDFAAARNAWRRAALSDYEYGYRKYCACHPDSPPETVVTVRGGAVVGVRHRPVDSTNEVPGKPGSEHYYWTIDDLFELIASARARGADVRATYDAARGFPSEIHIDYDKNAIGDELDVVLTTVTPLAR
jgi:uncharacterized protein DUF6174